MSTARRRVRRRLRDDVHVGVVAQPQHHRHGGLRGVSALAREVVAQPQYPRCVRISLLLRRGWRRLSHRGGRRRHGHWLYRRALHRRNGLHRRRSGRRRLRRLTRCGLRRHRGWHAGEAATGPNPHGLPSCAEQQTEAEPCEGPPPSSIEASRLCLATAAESRPPAEHGSARDEPPGSAPLVLGAAREQETDRQTEPKLRSCLPF